MARFDGGIYWDELAETCSDISRVAGFRGAAGNAVSDHCFVTVHLGLPWMGSGDQAQYIFALFTIPAHTNPLSLSLKAFTDCQKNSVFGGA